MLNENRFLGTFRGHSKRPTTDDGGKRIPKLNIFQNLVYLEQYDIICVCETWLILDNEILPGSTIHRKDRHDNARGGGVLIAVKNEIS